MVRHEVFLYSARLNICHSFWRGDRAVECTGLENRRGFIAHRGFESHPLRQYSMQAIDIKAFLIKGFLLQPLLYTYESAVCAVSQAAVLR